MRFAILADIHANWPALETVLEDIEDQPEIHMIYSLGDIIGYYTYPRECLDAVMGLEKFYSIRGNHDRYLIGQVNHRIKPATRDAMEFTRQRISDEQYAWVEGLKDKRKIRDHFLLVHGSPCNMNEYLSGPDRYTKNLQRMSEAYGEYPICFFGHTHKPVVVSAGQIKQGIHHNVSIKLERDRTYMINPGSVGQPRDGSPRASYLIYDSAEHAVHFQRLEYPYQETQQGVLAAGLAPKFADRLALGK